VHRLVDDTITTAWQRKAAAVGLGHTALASESQPTAQLADMRGALAASLKPAEGWLRRGSEEPGRRPEEVEAALGERLGDVEAAGDQVTVDVGL
jgi:hypothetical protein